MRRVLIVAALMSAFIGPVQSKDRSAKLERIISAMTAVGHCDLTMDREKAVAYWSSFGAPINTQEEEFALVFLAIIIGQSSVETWSSKSDAAKLCGDLVRWFGASGTEMSGMMTGTGKPID